ncbi:TraR/DksA C4-type zinc finger protein [Alicyclobacillus vulcanalis]|uniref:Transcriptional regulator, TraR/DksA family n=1 Tax=Alicyclobacillus vulcanalis TaxID=252246 RepID=A0A1N7NQ80_9BACL|nr:TraR/DksA C4-type zinc finger protein [Alicyclobacillus vulcanalis]SIT00553.1 transcriptional regulator, TraR/DksA family [Alicyclobacillus vulcanalis]
MDEQAIRSRLEEARLHLQTRLGGRETSADLGAAMPDECSELSMYDNHPADVATELALRNQAMGERLRDERALADVEAALERLKDGTYGRCVDCGQAIPRDRLEAMPTARRCVDCQRRLEKRQLAERRPVEEDVLSPAFGQFNRDGADETGYDGEDALQDVMRYDRPQTGLAYYDEPELDDDSGYVEWVEGISEEAYRRTLPSPAERLTDYDEP